MATPADEVLIDEMLNGRADALNVLFERYSRLVFAIVKRILGDPGEAEDLTQEVFLEIYLKARLYNRQKGSLRTWLLQYVYHRSFNRRKYLAARGFYGVSAPARLRHCPGENPEERDSVRRIDRRNLLQKGLKKLNDREREIIELVVIHGWTLREASVHVRQSYVNSRNIYYRGMRKLKELAPFCKGS
jgi:RNA polymerase sigma-70 factor (ECF subfamily)